MDHQYEMTDLQKEILIGRVMSYGVSCLNLSQACFGRDYQSALAKKTEAFKDVVDYLDLMELDYD